MSGITQIFKTRAISNRCAAILHKTCLGFYANRLHLEHAHAKVGAGFALPERAKSKSQSVIAESDLVRHALGVLRTTLLPRVRKFRVRFLCLNRIDKG